MIRALAHSIELQLQFFVVDRVAPVFTYLRTLRLRNEWISGSDMFIIDLPMFFNGKILFFIILEMIAATDR